MMTGVAVAPIEEDEDAAGTATSLPAPTPDARRCDAAPGKAPEDDWAIAALDWCAAELMRSS